MVHINPYGTNISCLSNSTEKKEIYVLEIYVQTKKFDNNQ